MMLWLERARVFLNPWIPMYFTDYTHACSCDDMYIYVHVYINTQGNDKVDAVLSPGHLHTNVEC